MLVDDVTNSTVETTVSVGLLLEFYVPSTDKQHDTHSETSQCGNN